MEFLAFTFFVAAAALMADSHCTGGKKLSSAPKWVTLDAAEVAVVKSTWAEVKNHEADILYALFKAYPDIQARFPAFVGKDLDSINGTAPFILHAARTVGFITEYVSLLGSDANQAAIKTILNTLGQSHRSRGIPKGQFNEIRTGLTAYLKTHSTWSDAAAHAWDDAFDKLYYVVFSALDGHPIQ